LPQVTCSKATAKVINVQAIEIAARLLGVENPIHIRTTKGRRITGCHRFSIFDPVHRITFSTAESAEDQSKTLWHELTHAAQTDQLGLVDYAKQYRSQNRSVGYRQNKFEVQARDCGDWHDALSLV